MRKAMVACPDLSTPMRDLQRADLKAVDYGDAAPPLDVQEIMAIILGQEPAIEDDTAMALTALRPATADRPLSLAGAFVRRTDLSRANLRRANLAEADLMRATARGADFKDAVLHGTLLRGTKLTDARNLTLDQLAGAIIDDATILTAYVDRAALLALMANRKAP